MCGIIGISAHRHVAADLYEGLIRLQHRRQNAAGIATFDGHFHTARGLGFVREAFTQASIQPLLGRVGIAHTRYTTAGSAMSASNIQPFLTNTPYGIAIDHNGNFVNHCELREELRVASIVGIRCLWSVNPTVHIPKQLLIPYVKFGIKNCRLIEFDGILT
jgi:amidophosphoribosyltransferase